MLAKPDWGSARHTLSLRRSIRRRAASALGIAGPGVEAVFVYRDVGDARNDLLLHRKFTMKSGAGFGHRLARGSGSNWRARRGCGSTCYIASALVQEEERRRL